MLISGGKQRDDRALPIKVVKVVTGTCSRAAVGQRARPRPTSQRSLTTMTELLPNSQAVLQLDMAEAHNRPASAVRTLTRDTESPPEVCEQQTTDDGPSATPARSCWPRRQSRWRSRRYLNVLVMIAKVDGIISAAPMPMLARRWPTECDGYSDR